MHNDRERVAARVRFLLDKDGRTKAWLAEKLHWRKLAVIRLLAAARPVTLGLVEQLAGAFGLSPVEFLCAKFPDGPVVWPAGDLEVLIKAMQDRALRELGDEIERVRVHFARGYVVGMIGHTLRAIENLSDLQDRLQLIHREVSIRELDLENREVAIHELDLEWARQDRETRPAGRPAGQPEE